MRYHDDLVFLRKSGQRPESVFLIVDCAEEEDEHWYSRDPGHARIAIDPRDVPHRLDLRFLVGCTVHVQGLDDRRVAEVYDAACKAGAARVAAVFDGHVWFHEHKEKKHG
jgi:fructose-1,6-bisphosphatase